uniref:White-opaque regulator 1 n=1 Tax=Talaromyces marneffei PM1 TaxID=1077442 RepID=A0A093VLC5_TALMA
MPNIGRPSRDCNSCRKRRIKCDLKYPECGQCLRKRWSCSGYRKDSDVLFRTETLISFPDNQSKDRRKKQIQQIQQRENGVSFKKQEDFDSSAKGLSPYRKQIMIHDQLSENWDNHFIPLALAGLRISADMPLTMLNVISNIISQNDHESPLYKALNAVGYAFLARTNPSKNTLAQRIKAYRNALTAVNSTLRDSQKCRTNTTLLTVWVLGLYEFLADPTNAGWHIHSQGLINLFRLRGSENYATEDGRYLYLLFFNSFQIQAIRTGEESYITESITLIHEIADHCNSSEYLPLRTCIFTYHCALQCSRIRKLLNEATDAKLLSSSESILQDMDNIEKATYPLSHKSFITENKVEAPVRIAHDDDSPGKDTNHPMEVDSLYRGSIMYRVNWRIRVSFFVLEFLQRVSTSPVCTSEQRTLCLEYRLRCMEEVRILAERASFYLGTPDHKTQSFSELVLYIRTVLLHRTGPTDGLQDFVIEEP